MQYGVCVPCLAKRWRKLNLSITPKMSVAGMRDARNERKKKVLDTIGQEKVDEIFKNMRELRMSLGESIADAGVTDKELHQGIFLLIADKIKAKYKKHTYFSIDE